MNRGPDRLISLGVMAKYWARGSVKTRLGATIGMDRAAQLHRTFCRHLAIKLADSAEHRSFVITPSDRETDFANLLPPRWRIEHQCDGDLGLRMSHWFRSQSGRDSVLIGADCPTLSEATVSEAVGLLENHDVVLGPAADGGYYLIALRGPWRREYAELFRQIPWSGADVFAMTCRRAEQSGLELATLSVMEDVDTEVELERLVATLRASSSDRWSTELLAEIETVMTAGERAT